MSAAQSAAPDLSIRAKPPSPRRLSRKVLLAGAIATAAVIAVTLAVGLSDRPDRAGVRSEVRAASSGPPETIAGAASDYAASDLSTGDEAELEVAPELQAPEGAFASPASPSTPQRSSPSPQETARASSLVFARAERTPAADDSDRLPHRLVGPRSRFELMAGSVIPAALLTELNSDLPGQVIAQVTAPVFDSVTGSYLLIPQGARLIGAYDNGVRYGDRRLLLRWRRLIFPDGTSINLENMPGGDPAGAAGVADRVDNHLDRLAAAVALSAVISVIANEAEDDDEEGSLTRSVGDAAAEQAAATGGRIVDRDLGVRPTLRVRAGALVRVLVARDISLRPWRERSR